jgi:hypothetical protein
VRSEIWPEKLVWDPADTENVQILPCSHALDRVNDCSGLSPTLGHVKEASRFPSGILCGANFAPAKKGGSYGGVSCGGNDTSHDGYNSDTIPSLLASLIHHFSFWLLVDIRLENRHVVLHKKSTT